MSTKPPPKTRSGEMPAVKAFYKSLEKFDAATSPALDVQVARMAKLFHDVTTPPPPLPGEPETLLFPPHRAPSLVDEDELAEAAGDDSPDDGDEENG